MTAQPVEPPLEDRIEQWVDRQAAKVPDPTAEQLEEVRRLLAPSEPYRSTA